MRRGFRKVNQQTLPGQHSPEFVQSIHFHRSSQLDFLSRSKVQLQCQVASIEHLYFSVYTVHLLRCSRNFSVQFAQIITVFYLHQSRLATRFPNLDEYQCAANIYIATCAAYLLSQNVKGFCYSKVDKREVKTSNTIRTVVSVLNVVVSLSIFNEQITISCFQVRLLTRMPTDFGRRQHVCKPVIFPNLLSAFCTKQMSSRKVSEFEQMSSCFSFRFPCCANIIPWIIDFSQKYEFFRIIGDSKNHMRKSFSKIILWVVFLETY